MSRVVARAVASIAAIALLVGTPVPVRADAIQDQIEELEEGSTYKVRLAAATALSKTSDDRAVLALSNAVKKDKDAAVRRVAALALKKIITTSTRSKIRKQARQALVYARDHDKDKKVRKAARKAIDAIDALDTSAAPRVFVNIPKVRDRSKKAGNATGMLEKVVRAEITRASKDYQIEWPGELPTSSELEQYGTQAFIVAAAVSKVTIDKKPGRTEVVCTVEIQVAPWSGTDVGEKWVAEKNAKATGSGKATTGTSEKSIAGGVVDCVGAVGEQLTSDKVVPFIKKLASSK